jgi:hypothetical protein
LCPREFCWFWREAGDRSARGLHPNLHAALRATEPVEETGCGCPFGLCTRLDPDHGDADWYEPRETLLEMAGLPWLYFVSSPAWLAEDLRNEFIQAARELWGEQTEGRGAGSPLDAEGPDD